MEVEARGPCMSDELYAGLERQLVALAGRKNAGWKVGLTSGQARDSMGAGFRPFGYILSERVFSSGAERQGHLPQCHNMVTVYIITTEAADE